MPAKYKRLVPVPSLVLEKNRKVSELREDGWFRMQPYCDGERPLEEVMYCENVGRAECLRCLDRFASLVVTHQRQDTRVSPPYTSSATES